MNVALFGSSGQFGSWLVPPLEAYGHVMLTPGFDLSESGEFSQYCEEQSVDAVINAAGWNNQRCLRRVREMHNESDSVVNVNSRWPGDLAEACQRLEIPFYHIGSEYVFGVTNGEGPFGEDVTPYPDSLYGTSKLMGDLNVLKAGGHVIRASLLPDRFPYEVAATNIISSKLRATEGCRRIIQFITHGLPTQSSPRLLHICGERRSIADFVRDELKQEDVRFEPLLDGVVRPQDSSLASQFPQDLL